MSKIKKTNLPVIILIIISMLSAFPASAASGMSDVSGHWAEKEINYWVDKDVIHGFGNNTFGPDLNIIRADAAILAVNALRPDTSVSSNFSYSDIAADHYAIDAVNTCYSYGFLNGYDDFTFHPTAEITRQEAFTLLFRLSSFSAPSSYSEIEKFSDSSKIADWSKDAVEALAEAGIINGYYDGTLRPEIPVTRAEFSALMYRIEQQNKWTALEPVCPLMCGINGIDTASIKTDFVSGGNYLFLPAGADLTALRFYSPDNENGIFSVQGDLDSAGPSDDSITIDLPSVSSKDADDIYHISIEYGDGTGSTEYDINILTSSVDAVFLNSSDPEKEGRSFVEEVKGNSTEGSMVMISDDSDTVYNGKLSQIKSRGSSSFTLHPKKSYQIKLDKKKDLLGNDEKVKTWVLLAQYSDPTIYHDKLCKDLAADMGLPGSPDCGWTDLYYDGEYRGTYLLSEKVQLADTGVNIRNLEDDYDAVNEKYGKNAEIEVSVNSYGNEICSVKGLTDPEDITYGYLLEVNALTKYDEHCWFDTGSRIINVKTPEDASVNAVKYISEYFQEFENAVCAKKDGEYTGINPDTGKAFTEYCDLDSMVKMYCLYLFSDNEDAYYRSTFFYKDKDIMYQGPIWDSDQTFGLAWTKWKAANTSMEAYYLIYELSKIPEFRTAVKQYYETEFKDIASGYASETAADYYNTLKPSERMNHMIWPCYCKAGNLSALWPASTTYEQINSTTLKWMTDRISYMDVKFKNW